MSRVLLSLLSSLWYGSLQTDSISASLTSFATLNQAFFSGTISKPQNTTCIPKPLPKLTKETSPNITNFTAAQNS